MPSPSLDPTEPCLVYQGTNLINGKRYIGYTSMLLKKRVSAHFSQAYIDKAERVFAKAIRKYGRDAFRFSILLRCQGRKTAAAEEKRLIALLRPEYNMTKGGDGIPGFAHSDEAKRKIGDAGRGKKRDPAIFVKMIKTRRENGTQSIQSPENAIKFREGCRLASLRRRKPIICLSDGRVFGSAVEAAEFYGVGNAAICLALKGKNATAANRFFSYFTGTEKKLEDPEGAIAEIRARQRELSLQNVTRKSVVCLTDGRQFTSVSNAAAMYGATIHQVSKVLRGTQKQANGHRFAYAEDK